MNITNNHIIICSLALMLGFVFAPSSYAQTNSIKNTKVDTGNAGLVVKVAPGELLPISVKLSNFGSSNRVDVTVNYRITDPEDKTIYSASETVAVETTASFIKTIQIPFNTVPGRYIAKSSIIYKDQVTPANTEFPFIVERKIFGLFQSDFYLYGTILIIVSIIAAIIGRLLVKKKRSTRFSPLEYPEMPSKDRIYYEILSDTISQMRQRVGDDAMLIAEGINGLKVDKETGRILSLTESPAKIIAELVSEYEKMLGKKVSFTLRKS